MDVVGRAFKTDGEPALVLEGGEHSFDDCVFESNFHQMVIVQHATVTFRRCRFVGAPNRAIQLDHCVAVIDHCTFKGNRAAIFCTGGTVTVSDCEVRGPGSIGVMFQGGATGTVVDTTILHVHDAAIMVRSGGRPELLRSVFAGRCMGVYFESDGFGTVRDCDIGGQVTAVWIGAGCDPLIEDCRLQGGDTAGIYFLGTGQVSRCYLQDHAIGFLLHAGADPIVRDCEIAKGKNLGIYAMDGALGTIERCRVGPHPSGAQLLAPTAKTAVSLG